MTSGNLNFVEPSGPLQACNGTDLHLYTIFVFLGSKQDTILHFKMEVGTPDFNTCLVRATFLPCDTKQIQYRTI